jgi:hypothetical protein
VVLFKATSARIREILARHAPYVSGMRYRLVDGQIVEAAIAGRTIEDGWTYTGAANSYIAGFALRGFSREDTGRLRLDVVTAFLRQKGTVTPSYDGRRTIIGRRNRTGG